MFRIVFKFAIKFSFARIFLSLFTHSRCLKPVLNVFIVLNTKEDVLKNMGTQTVAGPHWLW